ncbi:MAG: DUF6798 domain-containing protein [Planctomycetaceae bacterium]
MTAAPDAVHLPDSLPGGAGHRAAFPLEHRLLVMVLVALSFFAYGGIRAPVPAVNEPHYLSKGKHYWIPEWCAGDFFLESSNVHLVFYQTFGLPTVWLSLEQAAWLGRAIASLILAMGWTRLVFIILPTRWTPLWVAWGFLFLQACGNLSGEWIAGGIESKVPAYGFLFWSFAYLLERSWYRAALLAGLAISFHPVVGLWGTMAAAGALGWQWLMILLDRKSEQKQTSIGLSPYPLITSLLILCAAALPGLMPALSIVGVDSFEADYIQVYYRLDHHLDPIKFSHFAEGYYLALFVGWLIVGIVWRPSQAEQLFRTIVLMAAGIALVGLLAGYRTGLPEEMPAFAQRMKLLKLYPFRLFDAMLPRAAAVSAVGLVGRIAWNTTSSATAPLGRTASWGLFGTAMAISLAIPSIDRNASRMQPDQLADWKQACEWISLHTPGNAIVLTPARESWAFKWYAQRGEFVSFKDCPQDAEGIVKWNQRLLWLQDWAQRTYGDNLYSSEELRELFRTHGITHVLAGRLGPMEDKPIYQNGTFRVYSLVNANDP